MGSQQERSESRRVAAEATRSEPRRHEGHKGGASSYTAPTSFLNLAGRTMRLNVSDLLVIITIVAICFGTAMGISQFQPERSVSVLGIIGGALIMLMSALRSEVHASDTARFFRCPIHLKTSWPVCTYVVTGLAAILVAGLAIRAGLVFEVWLGMACGYAIGATLARHRKTVSATQAEVTTDHTDGHG